MLLAIVSGENAFLSSVVSAVKFVSLHCTVCVSVPLRMLYWTDRGDVPKIECSWMDGRERKILVGSSLGWPTGLSIDYTNNDRIYWSDAKENRIESILPSGEDRRTAVYIGEFWRKTDSAS